MVVIVKTFIGQLDIVNPGSGPDRELIVCRLLLETPLEVNRILRANDLEGWCIKREEDSTLGKIAILYQLTLGACEYTADFRRMCKLYEAHSSAPDLQTTLRWN